MFHVEHGISRSVSWDETAEGEVSCLLVTP